MFQVTVFFTLKHGFTKEKLGWVHPLIKASEIHEDLLGETHPENNSQRMHMGESKVRDTMEGGGGNTQK